MLSYKKDVTLYPNFNGIAYEHVKDRHNDIKKR